MMWLQERNNVSLTGSMDCRHQHDLNWLSKKSGVKIWGQVFHCANILFITINDMCYAKFRVDEDVTALSPRRSGRAQLRHPVPHSH